MDIDSILQIVQLTVPIITGFMVYVTLKIRSSVNEIKVEFEEKLESTKIQHYKDLEQIKSEIGYLKGKLDR
jgi:hypothetical protein